MLFLAAPSTLFAVSNVMGEARRFLRESVLFSEASPEAERAFGAYAADVTARMIRGLAALGCVATVLWWPADFLIYADAPRIRSIMFDWRLATLLCLAPLTMLLTWSARVRANPTPAAAIVTPMVAGLATWTCGRVGPLDAVWFGISYILPLATVAFVLPLWSRTLMTIVVAVAAWGGYFLLHPAHLAAEPRPWLTVSLMLWVVLISVAIGQTLYHYLRVGFVAEQAFVRANDGLEGEVRAQTMDLTRLAARIESLQERESTRVAAQLHRTMAEDLSAVQYEVRLLSELAGAGGVRLRLDLVDALMTRMEQTTQRMIQTLQPKVLDDFGLIVAINRLVTDHQERTGLAIRLLVDPPEPVLEAAQIQTLYRVLQEALTNVARHSKATTAEVALRVNATEVTLSVRDNGCGFTPGEKWRADAAGIRGMRERAATLGGECRVEAVSGLGTRVSLRLPHSGSRQQEAA